jgi:hypothetical protein
VAKPKISLDAIEQEFDLVEMFGESLDGEADLRTIIGERIIEKMITRTTDDRKGIDGRPLKTPYKDSYADSTIFKVYGKKKDKVNMTLTGDMLADIQILKDTPNKIVIGFNSGDQIPKAYNHNVGDTLPKRPFFGLNQKEIAEIKKEFLQEVRNKIGGKVKRP